MKINVTLLKRMKACDDGIGWFISQYGENGEVSEDDLRAAIVLHSKQIKSNVPLTWIEWGMQRRKSSVVLKYWNKHSAHNTHKVINRLQKLEQTFDTFDDAMVYIKDFVQLAVREMSLPVSEQSAAAKKIRKQFSIYCLITDEKGIEGWDLHIPK